MRQTRVAEKRHDLQPSRAAFQNIFLLLAIGTFCSLVSQSGRAAVTSWCVGSSDWGWNVNWTPSFPTSSDTAYIDNGGTATIGDQIPGDGDCANLWLGSAGTASGGVAIYGYTLAATNSEYIGGYGHGSVTQSGGTNSIGATLYVGYSGSSNGSYTLSGTGLLSAPAEYIGYQGRRLLSPASSPRRAAPNAVGASGLYLGYYATSGGSYTLGGSGLLYAASSSESIGVYGTGSLTQTGGSNIVTGANGLCLGCSSSNSYGSYTLSGNSYLYTPYESVGNQGQGNFTQTGGTHSVGGGLYLGYSSSSYGSYTFSAGSLSAAFEYVGYQGAGNFTQSGGTHSVGGGFYVGYSSPSYASSYTLSAGSFTAVSECIGYQGSNNYITGFFTQTGGTNSVGANGPFSAYSSSSGGSYSMSGNALLSSPLEYVGVSGAGSFTQAGGTNVVTGERPVSRLLLKFIRRVHAKRGFFVSFASMRGLPGIGQLHAIGRNEFHFRRQRSLSRLGHRRNRNLQPQRRPAYAVRACDGVWDGPTLSSTAEREHCRPPAHSPRLCPSSCAIRAATPSSTQATLP